MVTVIVRRMWDKKPEPRTMAYLPTTGFPSPCRQCPSCLILCFSHLNRESNVNVKQSKIYLLLHISGLTQHVSSLMLFSTFHTFKNIWLQVFLVPKNVHLKTLLYAQNFLWDCNTKDRIIKSAVCCKWNVSGLDVPKFGQLWISISLLTLHLSSLQGLVVIQLVDVVVIHCHCEHTFPFIDAYSLLVL